MPLFDKCQTIRDSAPLYVLDDDDTLALIAHASERAMTYVRLLFSAFLAAALSACMDIPEQQTTTASASVATAPTETFLFSWGMFADPVFDRDVVTFNRAFERAYDAPTSTRAFGFTNRGLETPDPTAMRAALSDLAQRARDGQDLVVVMLTTHGAPDVLAVKTTPDGPVSGVPADGLVEFLAPLQNDQQILILQACFSGSLIDDLRAPNRIILTAAAADRTSFGCEPESDNTWFIKSLNQAMAAGGSWQQIFARTQASVSAQEAAMGFPASNPQSFVGRDMRTIWTEAAR